MDLIKSKKHLEISRSKYSNNFSYKRMNKAELNHLVKIKQ